MKPSCAMDKREYLEMLYNVINTCMGEGENHTHAVLISFDDRTGQVNTYTVNASFDTAQMMVESAAAFITGPENEERTIN